MQQALLTAEGGGTARQTWYRAGCRLAQPAPSQPLPTGLRGEQPAVEKGSGKVIQKRIPIRELSA